MFKRVYFTYTILLTCAFSIHTMQSADHKKIALDALNLAYQAYVLHEKGKPRTFPTFYITQGNMMTMPVDIIVNPANSEIQKGGGVTGIITENNDPRTGAQLIPSQGDISGTVLGELKALKDDPMFPIDNKGNLPVAQAVLTHSGSILQQGAKTVRYVLTTVGPDARGNVILDPTGRFSIGFIDKNKEEEYKKLLFFTYFNSLLLLTKNEEWSSQSNFTDTSSTYLMLFENLKKQGIDELFNNPVSIAFPSISTGIFQFPLTLAAKIAIEAITSALHNSYQIIPKQRFTEVHIVLLGQNDYKQYESTLKEFIKNLKNNTFKDFNEDTFSVRLATYNQSTGNTEILFEPKPR